MYLCNYSTSIDWDAVSEERLGESYDSLVDYATPQGVIVDSEDLLAYREHVFQTIKTYYLELEQDFPLSAWHFTGWEKHLNPYIKRYGIYKLLPLDDVRKNPYGALLEPIAVIVVQEVNAWEPTTS